MHARTPSEAGQPFRFNPNIPTVLLTTEQADRQEVMNTGNRSESLPNHFFSSLNSNALDPPGLTVAVSFEASSSVYRPA